MSSRRCLSLVALLCAALLFGARPAWAQAFKTIENVTAEGWDISALDERIRAAVTKAEAPGAGPRERRAAAAALLARANLFRDEGDPRLYRFALGDFRRVLRFQPRNAEAREKADEIASIYRSMARPVPEYGNANPDGGYTVEMFRPRPRRIEFGPGGLFKDEVPEVSPLVARVYEVEARAGQALSVSVGSARAGGAVFDLFRSDAPGKFVSGARSRRYVLPSAGKYLIRVYTKGVRAGFVLTAELR